MTVIAEVGYFCHLEQLLLAWLCFGHGSECSRSENDQPFYDTSVTSTYWFFKACVVSVAVLWHQPAEPMALVTLWLSSRLWLQKPPLVSLQN